VRPEIGWVHYALTPDFDWWFAVKTMQGKTGGDGRFAFTEVPDGAVATAFVETGGAVGVGRGKGVLDVKLEAPGAVRGKVLGKRSDIKGLRISVRGGGGLGSEEGVVDKRTGKFEVAGVAPGKARVYIKRNNFDLARADVEIAPGKTSAIKSVKVKSGYLPCADPLVDSLKARLVDERGKPIPNVQLTWSSRWMDGGMNSDEDGIVRLAGGGVAIGGPPYLLRIASLKGESRMYRGVFQKVRKGAAVVVLQPLQEVTGSVRRGDAEVEHYRLFVVGPGEQPRVFWGRVEGGGFSVHVPTGQCRFVVGTVDGAMHVREVEVAASQGALPHDLKLK
jgi:hypothetical protein